MWRAALGVSAALLAAPAAAQDPAPRAVPDVQLFFQAAAPDEKASREALDRIARAWHDGYSGMIVDLARFMRSPRRQTAPGAGEPFSPSAPGEDESGASLSPGRRSDFPSPSLPARRDPSSLVRARLLRFLEEQTGQRFGDDLRAWRRWIWSRPYEPHPQLPFFKAALYGNVDRRMVAFFPPAPHPLIRLDEIDWGGVPVDGIPPLDHPQHVPAGEAGYLKDKHVVFGIALNGEARAYPQRILAWHELALDRVGGVELAIVYCTLCGTVIPYGAEVGGQPRRFGTSGLLYRSNKLMFDHETSSLWSSVEGRPVVGALAGSGLELKAHPVVTTTWREWQAEHPQTSVLSLDTGFERDYSEGAAYREYFSTDALMFEVPQMDKRLKNKEEVLTLLLPPAGQAEGARRALALSERFLRKNPIHQLSFAGHELLVVTSRDGANRVYASGGLRFARQRADGLLEDRAGKLWRLGEDALTPESESGGASALPRVAARRAFWFGWFAQFPETELVK